ncbi:hypothetical protein TTHERM_00568030 (macronuclear) [Tetrahymena thermophila SB210]|uniref:Uncharacterized protein n=1 Tax=Tetrahymena thermophila (strain SB210) TaxID=312017 RepID=Q24I72_TETTS|nr:hypothetical protein TTHERM_00568030 [Tetrahymena thermophila SB210]7W5Z_6B Chain 6B, Cytochrome c oxidase subunit 6B [Tetrahymena thermophila]7W5Z_6b Chain 6b, Cytochrome c oxidase subunit 6B [Tetrahymena thermophila]8B6H_DF Chain DF, Structural protein [Tetrahymena thermophila SB210]8B6H_Df Chain Df, Structural protein [Tetrahymena thermophila SB210]8BQS_DF Chain DF, Structural protein [Tetrahymena thermophila SB210]8BQS_Df Chain Df, Structural protein [Tetrahymena thermophila SB210]8GY|eukprot:XP_001027608.4 hypothetical protein TTHERM_00568030 [Tetrahymena thermophila SB210]
MSSAVEKKDLPADYGKMPAGYNFLTRGKDWREYDKDFILRTDAVWEKFQLEHFFRNYMKCFFFDHGLKKYQMFEPEDMYTVVFEGWALDDLITFPGFTPTGRTNSYQIGLSPRQRTVVPTQTFYQMQDYYMLCGLRFERWFRCDLVYHDQRHTKFDQVKNQKNYKTYPCYREYYEAQYACQDDMFDFLMELAYARRAADNFESDFASHELTTLPTFYDTPKAAERKTYTY